MPKKVVRKRKKSIPKTDVEVVIKNGLGVHWYTLIWLIVITVLLSTMTMVYAAWSLAQRAPESRLAKETIQANQQMESIDRRLRLVEGSLQRIENLMEANARAAATRSTTTSSGQ